MDDRLPALLAQLIPLAVVVAWSPVKILPPLALVLGANRPRATSLAYLAGTLASLCGATGLFIGTPHLLGGFEWSAHGNGAWVRVGLGVLLILLAGYAWTRRGRALPAAAWMSGLTRVTPTGAALMAVSLTWLNPKVMVATAAAGLAIATAGLGTAGTVVAVTGYTVLAGSTVIVPVLGYVVAADRVDGLLTVLRHRAQRHQAAVLAAVLAAVGAALVATGVIGI